MRTFLILDDDPDNRFLIRYGLTKAFPGAHVLEYDDADKALAGIREVRLDAVVSDHHLSTRDGASFITDLRSLGNTCPIVMVTASSDPAVHRRAYEAGASRVFSGNDLDFAGYLRLALEQHSS